MSYFFFIRYKTCKKRVLFKKYASFPVQDILSNPDHSLDDMFRASLIGDIIAVGTAFIFHFQHFRRPCKYLFTNIYLYALALQFMHSGQR